MNICLYGASSDQISPAYFEAVTALGRELGRRSHGLVFGGGSRGLMGAAARGVHEAGGRIIGVAPRFFDRPGILFEFCDEFIFTDTMRERKLTMEARADAFLAVPGGIGTLEEFFEMLTLKQLGRHRKPIALYNIGGYYDSLLRFLEESVEQGFTLDACLGLCAVFDEPGPCLAYLETGESPEIDLWRLKRYDK